MHASHDAAQTIRSLACTENALHNVVITVILIYQIPCLLGEKQVSGWFIQGRAGQTDPLLVAKGQCLAAAVYFVRKNMLWITAIALPIACHRPPEVFRFIERLKVQQSDSGIAVHQTDMQFWAKLVVGVGPSPDDESDPWLGQTGDAPGDAAAPGPKYDSRLLVDNSDYIQMVRLLLGQFCAIVDCFGYVTYIPADVLQLFFGSSTD